PPRKDTRLELRPLQKLIREDTARFKNAILHRRFGKSMMAVDWLVDVCETSKDENPRCYFLAPTYRAAKAIAWQMFLDLTEGPVIVQDSRKPFLAWEVVRNQTSLMIPAIVDIRSRDVRELPAAGQISGMHQSKDGRFITYTETSPIKTTYDRQGGAEYALKVLDLETDSVRAIKDSVEQRINLNWNSTGDRFAYALKGNVFVQSIADTAVTNLTEEYRTPVSEDDSTKLSYSVMHWRPDDAQLLVRSKKGYHLLDPDTKAIELVYELPEDEDTAPTVNVVNWSPDGSHLYMTYSAKDRWERGLVRYDLSSRQTTDLVKDGNLYGGWRFTKDGRKIFYN
ncbi:hypothetical protein LCGC14_3140130, partial [marine sediment metagenome]